MLLEINPDNIDQRSLEQVLLHLRKGGIIIFPTDTVYAMGCDLYNKKALNNLAALKGIRLKKARFSIICNSISDLSDYVKNMDRPTFKLINRSLPGPFTFVLTATNEIPRLFDTNRKEIGIRIPDNPILKDLTAQLGNPLATTSLHDDEDEIMDYFIDPYEIYERYDSKDDLIIDGGYGNLLASTVVECIDGNVEILRQGAGILEI
jgi:tRNA threonylcarbamoyl adenosine modification protein (Sua5/YciO/YrdC/YwlC family)